MNMFRMRVVKQIADALGQSLDRSGGNGYANPILKIHPIECLERLQHCLGRRIPGKEWTLLVLNSRQTVNR